MSVNVPSKRTAPAHTAEFRFYEELNDFLPIALRKRSFAHAFTGTPSVKDVIEALGVPHTEVDLILVNGRSVDFSYPVRDGDRISVYPVFESFDISPLLRLRPRPLRDPRFVLDSHLGRLAVYLRLLGFDTLYRNDYGDAQIVELARAEQRIILTRDKGLLKHGAVTHGYWLRETEPHRQTVEVLRVFDLRRSMQPFTRCMACNGELQDVGKAVVIDRLPPHVRESFDQFAQCAGCSRVYWPGSHYTRLRQMIDALEAAG